MAMINNVNHKNMIVMWNFLKGYAEEKGLKSEDVNIFEILKLPFPEKYPNALAYYTDPTQWSPLEIYVQCYLKTKKVTDDPNAFRNCGRSSAKYKSIANWRTVARSISGPMAAICYLPKVIPDWNDTKTFEIVEPPSFDIQNQEVKTTIRYTFHPHIDPCDDYCSDPHILGLLEAIPTNYPRHIYKPWETLPMGKVSQSLVQYDPVKLFSGIFFKHLDLKPFYDGNLLYITNPNTGSVQMIGRKVILIPSDIQGRQVHLGSHRDNTGLVRDDEITGTLILETIVVRGEPVCKMGVIMEAPYFIINYSFEELAITRKFWNLRCMFIGRNELLEEYFTANNALRAEIEEKNNAYAKVKEYADHLEELVDTRTEQYREQKEVAEAALREKEAAQSQLIHSEKMASLGTLAAGIAHEINNGVTSIDRSVEQITDIFLEYKSLSDQIYTKTDMEHMAEIKSISQRVFINALENLPLETENIRAKSRDIIDKVKAIGIDLSRAHAKDIASYAYEPSLVEDVIKMIGSINDDLILRYFSIHHILGSILQNVSIGKDRIKEIVRAMESYSHINKDTITEIDINSGIDQTLFLMKNMLKYGVKVEKIYEPDIPKPVGNPGEMNQVWTNIIKNAVESMNSKGKLTIETYTTLYQEKRYVGVRITDTGQGISEKDLPHIFEPFYTTKDVGKGTGLGLSIIQSIIKRHEGLINVHTKTGEGTAFEFLIPIKSNDLKNG